MTRMIFDFLIFPGFLFTAAGGMLVCWIDRKVTARIQWRVGPPLLQPVYDFVKLLGKETIVPRDGNRAAFLLAPAVGMSGILLVSSLLWKTILNPGEGFVGDLIVLLYLLTLPSLAVIVGGFASANPFASLGASREMKLILSYELPFILAVAVPVIKSGYAIRLGAVAGFHLASISGLVAFLVVILCQQAKLALVPFDMAEAETEIMAGALIEYSGPALAVHKLTRMMMLFTLPLFTTLLFLGRIDFSGAGTAVTGLLKYVGVLVLVILIRNTAPRVRIDQAMRFFWGPMTVLALLAVIAAFLGV